MELGVLHFLPAADATQLLAGPVRDMLTQVRFSEVYVSEIDPMLSDTAAFCAAYGIGMNISANCVIVEAKRADSVWYAACMILATDRADINGVVRRRLEARKISFAPMDKAVQMSGMEHGGITPIGLPKDWPILVDQRVANAEKVIIGGGIRGSKLLIPGKFLTTLPNTVTLSITKTG